MLSVISITSRIENQRLIKDTIFSLKDKNIRLKGQFSNCIDVLNIAPILKPDIIIVQEEMYFVGLKDFIRILSIRGVNAVYILLCSENSESPQYQNSRICFRINEMRLTSAILQESFSVARNAILEKAQGLFYRSGSSSQDENYPWIGENRLFARLISGQIEDSDYIHPKICSQRGYLIIARPVYSKTKQTVIVQDFQRMSEIYHGLSLFLEIYGGGNIFSIQSEEICVWFHPKHVGYKQLISIAQEIRRQLNLFCDVNEQMSFVLQCCDHMISIADLPDVYRELDHLERYHFFTGADEIITSKFLDDNSSVISYKDIQEQFAAMDYCIANNAEIEFYIHVETLFSMVACGYSMNTFSYVWNQLIFWYNLKIQEYQLSQDAFMFQLDAHDFSDIKELKNAVVQTLGRVYEAISGSGTYKNPHIEYAVTLLKNNFEKNYSLTDVSQLIHVNPAYLSSLFRQETGKTFVQMKNEIRIEHAKKLLLKKGKVYEVAREVGFENVKYFSQAFKKATGLTPQQFQNREKKQ